MKLSNTNFDICPFINEALNGNSDSSQHVITLFSIAISIKAKNILELGVRGGGTTLPFLHALEFTGGKLTSVDILEDVNLKSIFQRFNTYWNYVISDSIAFLNSLNKKDKFDLIFIDDWHDGNHLYNEITLIEPHVTPASIILIHDTMCLNTQPDYHLYKDVSGEFANGGPYGAISRLDPSIWEYCTIPVNNGLTILRKRGKVLEF